MTVEDHYALQVSEGWHALSLDDPRSAMEQAAELAGEVVADRIAAGTLSADTGEAAAEDLSVGIALIVERVRAGLGPSDADAAVKIAPEGLPRAVALLTHEWAVRSIEDTPESVEREARAALGGPRVGRRLRALETTFDESPTGRIVGVHHADEVRAVGEPGAWIEERCVFMIFPHAAPDALIVLSALTTDANAFTDMLTEIGGLAMSLEYPVGTPGGATE